MSNKPAPQLGATVTKTDDGLRLEVWLAQNIEGLSRHKAIEAIRNGEIWIDGRKAKKGVRVASGQRIEIRPRLRQGFGGQAHTHTQTQTSPEVLFSDKGLIVANKPAGMPCHALRLGETGTLLQWIGERFPEVTKVGKDVREGGLLHRLDTDTSGCVAFARDQKTFDELRPKFARGGIGKIYLAVVADCGAAACGAYCGADCGINGSHNMHHNMPNNMPHNLIVGKSVTIKIPLGRHPSDAGRMVALIGGEERHKGPALNAKTTIKTLAKGDQCALVEATIERGRMHQIRVHLAAIGHPIIGDKTYGGSSRGPDGSLFARERRDGGPDGEIHRQALHAYKLIIDNIETVAPVPKDFRELCAEKHIPLIN